MKTPLADAWKSFAAEVLDPGNAGVNQRLWMKRAFYGGATALYAAVMTGLTPSAESTPEAESTREDEDLLLSIHHEIMKFKDEEFKGEGA